MADTFKFPNGYDVQVLRKEDIIELIDDNTIDKDLLLTLVKECESDCANYLREGKWAGIPFFGNIRIPPTTQMFRSENSKAILNEAKEVLDKKEYHDFFVNFATDIGKQVKTERYRNYVISKWAAKNKKLFNRLVENKGIIYAKIIAYTMNNLRCVSSNEQI